ncbi:MAG: hypothetical protein AAGA54_02660 [Myxococcota bacterium]
MFKLKRRRQLALGFSLLAAPVVAMASGEEVPTSEAQIHLDEAWAAQAEWMYEGGYQGHDTFDFIQSKYLAGDGETFAAATRAELEVLGYLTSTECAVREAELLEFIEASGADGVDSLLLSYHECLTSYDDAMSRALARLHTARIQEVVWYQAEPWPNIPLRVASHNSGVERAVRSDAARALVEHLTTSEQEVVGSQPLDVMLRDPVVSASLCALEFRRTPEGELGASDLLRMGACAATGRPGGYGTIEEMCDQLFDQGSEDSQSSDELTAAMEALGASESDVGWLKDFCDNRAGGGALPGSSSPLDGYTEDDCTSGRQEDLEAMTHVVELMDECMGGDLEGGSSIWDASALQIPGGNHPVEDLKHIAAEEAFFQAVSLVTGVPTTPLAVASAGLTLLKLAAGAVEGGAFNAKARKAGCYTAGSKCEINADGDPICISGPCLEQQSSDTDSTSSSSSTSTGEAPADTTSTSTTTSGGSSSSSTGGASTPGGDGAGVDPNNPACQELIDLAILTPDGAFSEGSVFDYIRNRKPGEDPRKGYPSPDDMPDDPDSSLCGEMGSAGRAPTGAKCNLPITCAEGTTLQDDCTCSQSTLGLSFGERNRCVNILCPPDSPPAPGGGFDCMCSQEPTGEGVTPPRPNPPELGSVGVMTIADTDALVLHTVDVLSSTVPGGAALGAFE